MTNKFLLALLMASVSIAAMTEKPIPLDELDISEYTLEIPSALVRTQNSKSGLKLFCDKEGFVVKKGNTVKRVPSYDTDKLFRGRNLKQIAKYALLSNKFRVS